MERLGTLNTFSFYYKPLNRLCFDGFVILTKDRVRQKNVFFFNSRRILQEKGTEMQHYK